MVKSIRTVYINFKLIFDEHSFTKFEILPNNRNAQQINFTKYIHKKNENNKENIKQ